MTVPSCRLIKNNSILPAALGLFTGLACGIACSVNYSLSLQALAAFLVLVFIWLKPVAGILAIIALNVSIFGYGYFPQLQAGSIGLYPAEVILLLLLLRALPEIFCKKTKVAPVFLWLFGIFFLSVIAGVIFSIHCGWIPTWSIFTNSRQYVFYLLIPVVLTLVKTKDFKTIFIFCLITGMLVSIMMAVQYLLGSSHSIFLGNVRVDSHFEQGDITRSLPPGLWLIYPTAFIVFTSLRKPGMVFSVVSVVLLTGLSLSLTRSIWVPVMVGLCFVHLNSEREMKAKQVLLAVILLAVSVITFSGFFPNTSLLGKQVVERLRSAFYTDTYTAGDSYGDRVYENELALEKIKNSPVFGVGTGNIYGAVMNIYQQNRPVQVVDRTFIHNSYLGLWLYQGFFGFISFLGLYLRALWKCKQYRGEWRQVILGFWGYLMAAGVSAYFGIYFSEAYSIIVLSLSIAAVELISSQTGGSAGKRRSLVGEL